MVLLHAFYIYNLNTDNLSHSSWNLLLFFFCQMCFCKDILDGLGKKKMFWFIPWKSSWVTLGITESN